MDMLVKFVLMLLTSTALTVLITPFLRNIAIKNGLVDVPNNRKIHTDAVPRLGGIAIFASFLVAVWLAYSLLHTEHRVSLQKTIAFLSGGTIIFMLGVVDDIRGLNARQKLVVQIPTAFMLVFSGFLIDTSKLPFIGSFIGLGLTIIWLVGITNAINLIDGMDGLSSGAVIFASITLFIVSLLSGNLFVSIISIALLGSTLGFLWHNWHPAKIFMGDSGAMFLGFALAAVSIEISHKNGGTGPSIPTNAIFVPILALGLPITDTIAAISRRLWHRERLFSADQEHIHHKLLDAGFTVRQTALILYSVCFLLGATALVTTMVTSLIAMGIVVGVAVVAIASVGILGRLAKRK